MTHTEGLGRKPRMFASAIQEREVLHEACPGRSYVTHGAFILGCWSVEVSVAFVRGIIKYDKVRR